MGKSTKIEVKHRVHAIYKLISEGQLTLNPSFTLVRRLGELLSDRLKPITLVLKNSACKMQTWNAQLGLHKH